MSTGTTTGPGGHGPELSGLRGWLAVLCLYLIVLMPLVTVLGLIGLWQGASSSSALQAAVFFEAAFELALAGFALYAGLALYRMRPNAVAIAKIYFITILTLGVLGLAIVFMGPLVQPAGTSLGNMPRGPAVVGGLRQIILSAAWLIYLERSKRVRATYPGA